jgi:hypothetical protein
MNNVIASRITPVLPLIYDKIQSINAFMLRIKVIRRFRSNKQKDYCSIKVSNSNILIVDNVPMVTQLDIFESNLSY